MAVTPHKYSLPLTSIVKQGYSPSEQTCDPVETSTVWLTGDLRVCSLSSWDPTRLPTPVPTSLLPSLPAHQKIHTHTNIIFSPFDVYFNRSHQFTMLVWESGFSWLAISKNADLWRHNSKLSDLFQSVTGWPGCTSPGSLILVWLSLSSLLILPPSLTMPHILVPFRLWFSFLRAQKQKKKKNSLVFLFPSPSSTEWQMIGFSFARFLLEAFWPSWLFRVLKDKRTVLVLRKVYNIWVGREISWKGM